jgi:hypothetical protein
MEAAVGDRIVVAAAMISGPLRDGEIIQVGKQGEPPYLVRWSDDGRETLFFPGPDAHISHHHESVAESPGFLITTRNEIVLGLDDSPSAKAGMIS